MAETLAENPRRRKRWEWWRVEIVLRESLGKATNLLASSRRKRLYASMGYQPAVSSLPSTSSGAQFMVAGPSS